LFVKAGSGRHGARKGCHELQAFIGSIGAEPGPPEITTAGAVSSPDQY
jgi:hypothetical protein